MALVIAWYGEPWSPSPGMAHDEDGDGDDNDKLTVVQLH